MTAQSAILDMPNIISTVCKNKEGKVCNSLDSTVPVIPRDDVKNRFLSGHSKLNKTAKKYFWTYI